MVQPAENILDSDPAGGWQLIALNCRSPYWFPTKIWNDWPQAGVWASLIVVGNPLPQDRSKMLLIEGDHVVQALAADGPPSAVHSRHWPSVPARGFVGLSARMLAAPRRPRSKKIESRS